jgi:sugar lactone lactonase YvrE
MGPVTDPVPERVVSGLVIPEGPRWHKGSLWLSDIGGNRVIRVDPGSGEEETVTDAFTMPSGLGFLPDGDPLVVSMDEKKLYRITPGGPKEHADLRVHCSGMLNDMIVDSQGRAYVDANGHSFFAEQHDEPMTPDVLVLVTPDGEARVVADELRGPNGVRLTEDERTLISAESPAGRLTAFDVEADGSLTNRRLFADIGTAPDGMCLDAEGAVWAACPVTGEFVRVLDGGEITHRIPVPGRIALACVLGGEDRRTLFMMTAAPHDLSVLRVKKTDGAVERIQVDVPGAGRP